VRTIAPLFVCVPYIAYVLNDRITDHNERRAERDYQRSLKKDADNQ
jgi:hypothetical protein